MASVITEGAVRPGGRYCELGTFEHHGRAFTAGGAVVSDLFLRAYLGAGGKVTTWDDTTIGQYVVNSRWRIPGGILSDTMVSVSIRLADGRRYVGRSLGQGMVVNAHRAACDVSSWPRKRAGGRS